MNKTIAALVLLTSATAASADEHATSWTEIVKADEHPQGNRTGLRITARSMASVTRASIRSTRRT